MQDFHFVHLLQLMCIEELGVYMLCEIALHVTRLDLYNTSGIGKALRTSLGTYKGQRTLACFTKRTKTYLL